MTIWEACDGAKHIQSFEAQPWRVVEAQHVLSSRDLVDTSEEHDLLEELLEQSKPVINKIDDYLIFTPFRYPPLKYGSRFGQHFEPSLWYGSHDLKTAFAEVAYYRLMFINDSEAELGYIELSLTAFNAAIKTANGLNLTQPPFVEHRQQISAKNTYEYSQALGSSMRNANIDAFIFYSARDDEGQNIAAFTSKAFVKIKNLATFNHQTWQCIADESVVEFTRQEFTGKKRYCFEGEKERV